MVMYHLNLIWIWHGRDTKGKWQELCVSLQDEIIHAMLSCIDCAIILCAVLYCGLLRGRCVLHMHTRHILPLLETSKNAAEPTICCPTRICWRIDRHKPRVECHDTCPLGQRDNLMAKWISS
ncbi:hypothetical protein DL89DRAFT_151758 [Linderina pennispora]|uniref:Uncharacterized protein n=1 Tax=Linderina pennispora TaxID=61395 RepID=A0A1Y1W961_9FUNG|nr:uncharacterized protein DL89DRAFT_151758 [Linderina pennispora]ORX70067.1 hypothetical protein DL89DRAFT_151758 [Linderina pennispora]